MIPTYSFTAEEIKFLLSQRTIAEKRLLGNVRKLESFPQEVLLVGAYYPGIWLEHNQDNEFLTEYNPEAAWASQELFINKQREIAQKDKMAHDNVKIRMQIFAMQFYNNQMRAA